MNSIKMIAIILIVAGILGVAYGRFHYTKETEQAKIGSVKLATEEKKTVNIPSSASVGAIILGGVLLILGTKKTI